MSLSSRSVKTPSVKRVTFQDSVENSFKGAKKDGSSVEILELFPNLESKSILRNSNPYKGATLSPMSDEAKEFLSKRRRRKAVANQSVKETKRNNLRFNPPKQPTETLAHAMLRSMTHREPSKKSKLILPRIALVTDADRQKSTGLESPRSQSTSRSFHSLQRFMSLESLTPRNSTVQTSFDRSIPLPEIITSSVETNVIRYDRVCGLCLHYWKHRRRPAAGFCRYCDEYLCADCVHNHRGRLTRLHPVTVFYCETCKEMNILNRNGSGYCVKCKQFFCSVCVVLHCTMNNHEVLEGKDLLDVTDVMIGK